MVRAGEQRPPAETTLPSPSSSARCLPSSQLASSSCPRAHGLQGSVRDTTQKPSGRARQRCGHQPEDVLVSLGSPWTWGGCRRDGAAESWVSALPCITSQGTRQTRAVVTPKRGGQLPGACLLPAKSVIQPSFKPACPTGGTEPGWLRHAIASVKLARAHTIRSACQMWKDKQHSSQHQARVVQTDNTQCNINLASTELSQHCFLNKSEAAE